MNKNFWVGLLLAPVFAGLYWGGEIFFGGGSSNAHSSFDSSSIFYDGKRNLTEPKEPVMGVVVVKNGSSSGDLQYLNQQGAKKDTPILLTQKKPVILHFWASWCGACAKEMPHFDALYKKFGDTVTILPIVVDLDYTEEGMAAVKKFYGKVGVTNMPMVFDAAGADLEGKTQKTLAKYCEIRAFPTTVFLNARGDEIGSLEGGINWEGPAGEAIVKALLAVGNEKDLAA